MTVELVKVSKEFTGNDSTTEFPYDFFIPDAASLRVYRYSPTTGTETLVSSSSYEVTGLGDDDYGSVTYPLSGDPLPTGEKLIIKRLVPYHQNMDVQNQGGFFPEVLEDQLDRMVMQTQQLAEEVGRALRMPQFEGPLDTLAPVVERAGKVLGFAGDGGITYYTPTGGGIPVSSGAINVLSYMDGLPDGSTPNNEAILAAVAAAGVGDTIVFPNAVNDYVYHIASSADTIALSQARVTLLGEGARIKVTYDPSVKGIWPMFRVMADRVRFVNMRWTADNDPYLWNINLQYSASQYFVRGVVEVGTDSDSTVVKYCTFLDCEWDNVTQCAISGRQAYGTSIIRGSITGVKPYVTLGTVAITTGLNYMGIALFGCENSIVSGTRIHGMVEGIATGRTNTLTAQPIDFGYGFGIPEDSLASRITTIANVHITAWWDHAVYASVGSFVSILGGQYHADINYRQGGAQAIKPTGQGLLIMGPNIRSTSGISIQKIGSTIKTEDVLLIAPIITMTSPWENKWRVSTDYEVGDIVVDHLTLEVYAALVGHTSGTGTFAADRTANPSYWNLELSGNQVLSGNNRMGVFLQSVKRAVVRDPSINYIGDDYHGTTHGIRLGNQVLSDISYPCEEVLISGGNISGRLSVGVGVTESSEVNEAIDVRIEDMHINLLPKERGDWVNEKLYFVGDIARDPVSGDFHQVLIQHTSAAWGTSFSSDRSANPTYWTLFAEQFTGTAYTTWALNTAYVIGNVRRDSTTGVLYEAQANHTSPASGTFGEARSANPSQWDFYSEDIENSAAVQLGYSRRCRVARNSIENAGIGIAQVQGYENVLEDNDMRGMKYNFIRTTVGGANCRSLRNRMSDWKGPVFAATSMTDYGEKAYNDTTAFIEITPAEPYLQMVDRGNWMAQLSYIQGDIVTDPDDSKLYRARRAAVLPSAWATLTAYAVGDMRSDAATRSVHIVRVAHTSGGGTFAADRAANPTYWGTMYADMSAYRTAFPYHWTNLTDNNYVVPYPGDSGDIYTRFAPATAFNIRFINSAALRWAPGLVVINNGNTGSTSSIVIMQSGAGSYSETLPTGKSLEARSSGGADAWFSTYKEQNYLTQGRNSLYVPANRMVVRTTGGATALASVEFGAAFRMVEFLAFADGVAAQYAQFSTVLPKKWNRGQLWARFFWSGTTDAGNIVRWQIQAAAVTDTETLNPTFGSAVAINDILFAVDSLLRSGETAAMTVGSAPTSGDELVFQVFRDPTHVNDTSTATARLHGVEIFWISDLANDD
jgi:hypothetical protein